MNVKALKAEIGCALDIGNAVVANKHTFVFFKTVEVKELLKLVPVGL